MLENIYQDVWTQVFARTWCGKVPPEFTGPNARRDYASAKATAAARAAMEAWDPMEAHATVAAKGQQG